MKAILFLEALWAVGCGSTATCVQPLPPDGHLENGQPVCQPCA